MLTNIRSTREKLLRAALTLIAREGFPAATTAAIADAAGVAEGTLYRHFASKDDLIIEAYRAFKAEILEAVREDADAAVSPDERLARFWRAMFECYRADTDAFLFGLRFGESELAKREGGAAGESFKAIFADIYKAGRKSGVFKDLPVDLLAGLFQAPIGHMLKLEIAGRRWRDEELDAAAQAIVDSWRA